MCPATPARKQRPPPAVVALGPSPVSPLPTLMMDLQRERMWPLLLTNREWGGESRHLPLRKSVIDVQVSSLLDHELGQVTDPGHLSIPSPQHNSQYTVSAQYMLSEWLNI